MDKHDEWRQKQREEEEFLKSELEEEYGVQGFPKTDLLFELCWQWGHGAGEEEVESYYADFVRLIKP